MPFERPTLSALILQGQADLARALRADAVLRFSPEDAMVKANVGLAHGLHGHLDWIARQAVPYTATGEYLEAWAAVVGVLRKPASAATGSVRFPAAEGSVLFLGSVLARLDSAATYVTTADAAADVSGVLTAPVTASLAGSAGNAPGGAPIVLRAAVAGVQSLGAAYGPLAGGADDELDDPFRTRMLLRWARPPQGGAEADYLEWALAVPGVTRAWINPRGAGAGSVVVYSMRDVAQAAHGGFPQGSDGVAAAETRDVAATGDQLLLADALYPLRPVTALVYSVAPIAYPVAFAIHPHSALATTVRDAVLLAIDGVFLALASPLGDELETSPFEAAIAAVPGMPDFTLTTPAAAITPPLGRLPIRGAVTYV